MRPLKIVGMGPGSLDYLTPAAEAAIRESEVIAAGRRHLRTLDELGEISQERILIDRNLKYAIKKLEEALREDKNVVVCVSGDTGFYSLLEYLKKRLDTTFETIPGISSLSYFFARLNMSYQDAALLSVHGREIDLKEAIKDNHVCAFLTDKNCGVGEIAEAARGENVEIVVGENLSYPDEKITVLTPEEARAYIEGDLNAVIVRHV